MMLCMLTMRNKGLKGKCKETGVAGSERNESQRNCTQKPRCRKMHGQNVKNRTAGTKRERNASKQFMGNGWMEWAGKRMDKKDAKLMEMKGR